MASPAASKEGKLPIRDSNRTRMELRVCRSDTDQFNSTRRGDAFELTEYYISDDQLRIWCVFFLCCLLLLFLSFLFVSFSFLFFFLWVGFFFRSLFPWPSALESTVTHRPTHNQRTTTTRNTRKNRKRKLVTVGLAFGPWKLVGFFPVICPFQLPADQSSYVVCIHVILHVLLLCVVGRCV